MGTALVKGLGSLRGPSAFSGEDLIPQRHRNQTATCGNAANIIPRISRDWRQTAALGDLQLHAQ
ncbi:hypothetical protein GCM10009530_02640 [Microbispora corallina]|uniref:Uncharacterized protein n=1 Tax=Microbispora corallina TaxID=83302 RepID=A0ABQ4FRQ7_9ACTN|nr:hypothetical protein Mco01_05090 [Microbispora corallina]